MIAMLQKKFIKTAMLAITILLLVLLGAINIINYYSMEDQTDRLLMMLYEKTENKDIPPRPILPREGLEDLFRPHISEDNALSARYFSVVFDTKGTILHSDVSHIAAVSRAEAESYAVNVLEKKSFYGKVDDYKYCITPTPTGYTAIFLQITPQITGFLRIVVLSIGVGFLCWCGMLLLVVALSKRTIRPIAINFEKQKQFVTNAGHEIKTPLSIILSNTEALELYQGESKWSQNIRTQTIRLNGLMQQLLLLAKMDETDSLQMTKQELSVSQLLQQTIDSFYAPAQLRQIQIQTEIQPDIKLIGNAEYLSQLFSILLDNALKYTNAAGNIFVSLSKNENGICLQQSNTCETLEEIDTSRLFDRFYRADCARTQKSGGYGIGLSIAYAIVQAHHGKIQAQIQEPNQIVFTIDFS